MLRPGHGRQEASRRQQRSRKGFGAAAADLDKVAAPLQDQAVDRLPATGARPSVAAAKGNRGRSSMPRLAAARRKLDAAAAAATTPGDKLKLGELDVAPRRARRGHRRCSSKGLRLMIDSGVLRRDTLGQLQFLPASDRLSAEGLCRRGQATLKPAIDARLSTINGMLEAVLAEAYKRDQQAGRGAADVAQRRSPRRKAAGTKPSESWRSRTALQAAYDAKQAGPGDRSSAQAGAELSDARQLERRDLRCCAMSARYQAQESLDLMRLMDRTRRCSKTRDYIDYIQAADPRRFPGEALKVIDAGRRRRQADGQRSVRRRGAGRIATGPRRRPTALRCRRSSAMPARRPATVATVSAAADAFLSYGEPGQGRGALHAGADQAGRRPGARADPPRHRAGRSGQVCRGPGDLRQGHRPAQAARQAVVGSMPAQKAAGAAAAVAQLSEHCHSDEGRQATAALFVSRRSVDRAETRRVASSSRCSTPSAIAK